MTMRQSSGSVRILDARLTRSLADFAKLVELFDGHGVSFVSVTQQFNTTTSMGRLTLNVLLSFAQFEREVTSERIRDKISRSKPTRLWLGAPRPRFQAVAVALQPVAAAESAPFQVVAVAESTSQQVAAVAESASLPAAAL